MLCRFTVCKRQDGRVGLFSPEAKQAIVLREPEFREACARMMKAEIWEILPNRILEGLGLGFGEISETGWNRLVSISRKLGGEVT